MRNLTKKIAVIFSIFLITAIIIISTFILLINNGKLTSFIEQKINKKTNLNIKIGDIHLDILSSFRLKQISLWDPKNQKRFVFRCSALVVHYKPFELLKGHIKRIALSDVQINFDTEGTNLDSSLTSPDAETPSLSIKDLFPSKIYVENVYVGNAVIQLKIKKRILLFSEVNMQINDFQSARQSDISINGNISISNNFIKNLNVKTEKIAFKANEFELLIEAIFSPSDTEMKINANGKCIVRQAHLWIEDKEITALSLPITFTMDYPNQITLSSNVIKGELPLGNADFHIEDLISNIKMDINLKSPDNMLFQVSIDTAFSNSVLVTGNLDKDKKIIKDTTLKIHNINCKTLSKTFKSLIPKNYKDWSFDGSISLDTTLSYIDKYKPQEMKAITNISFSEIKFASPDYDYFGEKIKGHLEINANIDHSFNRLSFHTNGTLAPFLIEIEPFTTDMKSRETHLSINGYYDIQKRLLSEIEGTLSWENLGAITVDGNVLNLTDAPSLDLNIEMKGLSNDGFFETFIKDSIQYSNPALYSANIYGETNAQLHVKAFKNAIDVDGYINIKESSLKYEDVSIEDLNVNLPISITYPYSKPSIQKHDIPNSQYGDVQIKKLSYGPLETKDIHTNLIIISNNLFIKDPTKIPKFI